MTSSAPIAPERRAAAIDAGLTYAGLRSSQRGLVERYLEEHPDDWKNCCGSSCDPCVLTIGLAVDRARSLLGMAAFGSRTDPEEARETGTLKLL